MENEILEKKPSNPVESALLVLSTVALLLSIFLSWQELSFYLQKDDNFEIEAKERIEEAYKGDREINKLKKEMKDQKDNIYQFISTQGGGQQSN